MEKRKAMRMLLRRECFHFRHYLQTAFLITTKENIVQEERRKERKEEMKKEEAIRITGWDGERFHPDEDFLQEEREKAWKMSPEDLVDYILYQSAWSEPICGKEWKKISFDNVYMVYYCHETQESSYDRHTGLTKTVALRTELILHSEFFPVVSSSKTITVTDSNGRKTEVQDDGPSERRKRMAEAIDSVTGGAWSLLTEGTAMDTGRIYFMHPGRIYVGPSYVRHERDFLKKLLPREAATYMLSYSEMGQVPAWNRWSSWHHGQRYGNRNSPYTNGYTRAEQKLFGRTVTKHVSERLSFRLMGIPVYVRKTTVTTTYDDGRTKKGVPSFVIRVGGRAMDEATHGLWYVLMKSNKALHDGFLFCDEEDGSSEKWRKSDAWGKEHWAQNGHAYPANLHYFREEYRWRPKIEGSLIKRMKIRHAIKKDAREKMKNARKGGRRR